MATLNIKINRKSLECSVCLETVSDPRILPCGHTFCGPKSPEKCLQQLDPTKTGTIKCPNCQTDHHISAAEVPPDIKCKEMLESLHSNKQGKRLCHKHSEEIILRCITDGDEICLTCVATEHSGHQVQKAHKQEQTQPVDFWNQENKMFEDKQLGSRRGNEYSLDNQLGDLMTRRDAVSRKLAFDYFMPATANEGGSTSRQDVGMTSLREENVNCTTNILALGKTGRHLLLGLNDNTWEQWKGKRSDYERGFGAICLKEKVYIIGGLRKPIEISSKVDIFHIRKDKWTKGPDLHIPRWDAATCFVESERSIYVCGGHGLYAVEGFTRSVEKLELDENGSPVGKWREVTPMREKRWACAAVAVGSRLFVTGGIHLNSRDHSSVEILDTDTNEWNYGPQMTKCRFHHAVERYDGCIYAMGGRNMNGRTESCEKLDLQSWTWASIESMCVPRFQFGSVVAKGKIYVVGGYTKGRKKYDMTSVEIYNPLTNKWSRGPQLPGPLKDSKCVCW